MTVTLSSSLTDVSFSKQPASIVRSIEKDVETYTFSTGDVEVLDKFKRADRLTLTFVEYGNVFNKIHWLNELMDDQLFVILSGLGDTNLNVPYRITDLRCEQSTRKYYIDTINKIYDITITFERMYDRLS